eukprot:scaffold28797_cov62-Phaeocystis_antarctica.AAC.2
MSYYWWMLLPRCTHRQGTLRSSEPYFHTTCRKVQATRVCRFCGGGLGASGGDTTGVLYGGGGYSVNSAKRVQDVRSVFRRRWSPSLPPSAHQPT